MTPSQSLESALEERYGADFPTDLALPGLEELARMAGHRVHRKFDGRPVPAALLRLLLACAFSAPSKSDLQQSDVIHVADRAKVKTIADSIPDMPWIASAPVFLVFCGNNCKSGIGRNFIARYIITLHAIPRQQTANLR